MKAINLDELSKYTPWVSRLLGLSPFEHLPRDATRINNEYNEDKYARMLNLLRKHSSLSLEQLGRADLDMLSEDKTLCISKGNRLYLTTAWEASRLRRKTFIQIMKPYLRGGRTIVELGSGYGYNLEVLRQQAPSVNYIGGDYAPNAITAGQILFKNSPNVIIEPFNFYDSEWTIFDHIQAEEQAIVFTWHAIEQLPDAKCVFVTMAKYYQKIYRVIHLEPVYELYDSQSPLDKLRLSYTLVNDYNRNLITSIKETGGAIRTEKKDILGINPLNPTSLVVWES